MNNALNAKRLEGKRIIVTGAASGIGRSACLRFAGEGALVFGVDVDADGLEDLSQASSGGVATHLCDVSSADQMESAAAAVRRQLGGLDGVYANAGIDGAGSVTDVLLATWDRVIAINLTGVFLTDRVMLPLLIEAGGGVIVNQASVGGLIGVPGIAPYAAAKAGVIGLTRSLAVDFAKSGIRANALCPGTVPTPLVERTYRGRGGLAKSDATYEEMLETSRERYPLGRLGDVDDIVNMCLFLLSDESSWVTGQCFVVDGGLTAV